MDENSKFRCLYYISGSQPTAQNTLGLYSRVHHVYYTYNLDSKFSDYVWQNNSNANPLKIEQRDIWFLTRRSKRRKWTYIYEIVCFAFLLPYGIFFFSMGDEKKIYIAGTERNTKASTNWIESVGWARWILTRARRIILIDSWNN